MRSGWLIFFAVEFHGWNSMTFICAADSSAWASGTVRSGAWPGKSLASSAFSPGMLPASSCFWKNSVPATPSGPRTSASGRPARCGSMRSATLS